MRIRVATWPQYETIPVPFGAVEYRQRLTGKRAVPETGCVRRKGIAANVRPIGDHIAAMHPPAISDELTHFRSKPDNVLIVCHGLGM